ncbi:MAG: DNA mismatch repair endonuclease MutL [Aquificaceae bacterium]
MWIEILPEEIKSQIISGEIIEGPVECVKELMENSLDAKATKVEVEIIKGGKRFISVRDNGIGIPSEDIKKTILSGATSKIRSLEDLQSLNTYGFRGEALHAISLVSRFTLRSRFYQEGVGREIRVEGGKVVAEREVGMPVGTHAEVYDIFYNLPLRGAFLKREDVERKRIYRIFKALALANPSVAFRMEAEGKEVFNFRAVDYLKDRVEDVFEERFEHLMGEEGPFKVDLFLSDRARDLFLFINNRPVNNRSLIEYIKRSTGRWKTCVCYIQAPPYLIDVNIHPKKAEVRILREGVLKDLIRRTLSNKNWTGPITLKQSTKGYALEPELIGIIDNTLIVVKYGDYLYFFDQHLLAERYIYEAKGVAAQKACKASIRAGDRIDEKTAKALVESWLRFENKEACPHGRPLYYRLYLGDLYKKLGREY